MPTPSRAFEDLGIGTLFAERYRIVRHLGQGGQGAVFLADDVVLSRRVALKMLTAWSGGSVKHLERFRREALILSRIDHPGIATVFDFGTAEGTPYLAMRYVEGPTLAALMRRTAENAHDGTRSMFVELGDDGTTDTSTARRSERSTGAVRRREVDDVAGLVEKIARALHAAHQAGIVHRDVKPANIIVSPSGEPVVLDFGMARHEESDLEPLTLSGEIFGTPAYMSPEQAEGAGVIDRRSDVFSLGVVLYESLTLVRPFSGATRKALFHEISGKTPRDPRALNPAIPQDLAIVVMTALEKDVDRRYQSAEDLAEDLRRVRAREPILARPVGAFVRGTRWFLRHPVTGGSLLTAFIALVLGTLVSLDFARRAIAERDAKDRQKTEYERLADARRLEVLRAEVVDPAAANALLAPETSAPGAFDAWLERARQLTDRSAAHRHDLALLRERALPESDRDRERDRWLERAASQRIAALRILADETAGAKEATRNAGGAPDRPILAALDRRRDRLAAEIRRIETRLGERRSFTFARDEDQWRHDRLAELCDAIESFAEPAEGDRATIPAVREMLGRRRGAIEREKTPAFIEAWRAACEAVRTSPKYAGLLLHPNADLWPLGTNAEGFYEFAFLPSGAAPAADPAGIHDAFAVDDESAIIFTLLPGGPATIGSPVDEPGRMDQEDLTAVDLAPFLIARHETTQAQWLRLAGTIPSHFRPGGDVRGRPSDEYRVTWIDPVEFISFEEASMVALEYGLVLPTEAQWEYAARGGTRTHFAFGDNPESLAGATNIADSALHRMRGQYLNIGTAPWDDGLPIHGPVNSGRKNGFGLYGIGGNVSEFCKDIWAVHPSGAARAQKTGEITEGPTDARVLRDGSWLQGAGNARPAQRSSVGPGVRIMTLGVRFAAVVR